MKCAGWVICDVICAVIRGERDRPVRRRQDGLGSTYMVWGVVILLFFQPSI